MSVPEIDAQSFLVLINDLLRSTKIRKQKHIYSINNNPRSFGFKKSRVLIQFSKKKEKKKKKSRVLEREIRGGRADKLVEFSSTGKHDDRNSCITKNGKFISLLEQTISSLRIRDLPVG